MDEMWAAASVAYLGAFGIPVPFIAFPPSAAVAVISSPTIGAAAGGGKYEGSPVPDEGLFGHTVVLGSRECVCNICWVYVSAFSKAVLNS